MQKKAEEIQAAQDRAMEAAITEIIEEKKQQAEDQEDYEIKVENVTMTFRIIQNAPSSVKEYMIQKMKKETGLENVKVIATGGLGKIIVSETDVFDAYDQNLTLDGLRILYEKNKK